MLVALWVCILLGAAFSTVLPGLVGSWFDPGADMEHGFLVPIVAGAMAWSRRDALRQIAPSTCGWGAVLIAFSTILVTVGIVAQWMFLSRLAVVVSLLGCVLYLRGPATLREVWVPLVTLLFMITPPTFIYADITFRLQLVASRVAELTLDMMNYSVLREGNILELAGVRLSVAEACSGIRSLLTLFFFFWVYSFFLVRGPSLKVVLLISVIPLAILGNAFRIIMTGVASHYDHELAAGFYHGIAGRLTVMFSAVAGVLLHKVLERVPYLRPVQ